MGKLRRAQVQPRPLMLFIGKNNSGKSYLASLLWGLLAEHDLIRARGGPAQDACFVWAQEILEQLPSTREFLLSAEQFRLLSAWLSEVLLANQSHFVQSIFDSSEIGIDRLSISLSPGDRVIRFEDAPNDQDESLRWRIGDAPGKPIVFSLDLRDEASIGTLQFVEALVRALLFGTRNPTDWSGNGSFRRVAFLPASRTGFMLTYKAVVKQQLRRLARRRDPEPSIELPLPMVSFLVSLAADSSKGNGPFAGEADFLERAALEGALQVTSSAGINEYSFVPRIVRLGEEQAHLQSDIMVLGTSPIMGRPLPIQLSSSLVTEIAPLVMILRYSKHLNYLVLEEPEAHLYPHLQRIMAQLIARLIRKGVAIWLTTHSENFCQQINNFISLGNHPQRAAMQAELGYSSEDYLLPDEVGAYQFKSVGLQSELVSLVTTDQGIAMPSFNEELLKLAQESQRLSESREVE